MGDDTSNDAVEFIDTEEVETERDLYDETERSDERPIMLLLKRLIRNKQNTVMTNSQIMEILKQEFTINIDKCHELEIDIYIKIIKKYLKDWPQWEELERISSKLSSAKDYEAVTKVLNHKYKNLKEYLGVMLTAAKPLAKKAVEDLPERSKKAIDNGGKGNSESEEVVMEVRCTRDQLKHLIFRTPCKEMNNTIFNVSKIEPTTIALNVPSFETILNSWWTKITITTPNFIFHRKLSYKFSHKLVNKVRNEKTPLEIMDTRLYYYNQHKKTKHVLKSQVFEQFNNILTNCSNQAYYLVLDSVFRVLINDMQYAPDDLKYGHYRKFANKYKYVRYFYVDNTQNHNTDSKYDLQIEESMTPSYEFLPLKIENSTDLVIGNRMDWLKIECLMCKVKFNGPLSLMSQLQAHFSEQHLYEPLWQCSNCEVSFNMEFLAENRWRHEC